MVEYVVIKPSLEVTVEDTMASPRRTVGLPGSRVEDGMGDDKQMIIYCNLQELEEDIISPKTHITRATSET